MARLLCRLALAQQLCGGFHRKVCDLAARVLDHSFFFMRRRVARVGKDPLLLPLGVGEDGGRLLFRLGHGGGACFVRLRLRLVQ